MERSSQLTVSELKSSLIFALDMKSRPRMRSKFPIGEGETIRRMEPSTARVGEKSERVKSVATIPSFSVVLAFNVLTSYWMASRRALGGTNPGEMKE